jgi:hypothetical protein
MAKKYRGVKFGGDDPYSWAVFLAADIKGLRSPISEYTRAKPFYSGLNMSQKNYYIKMLEEADEKKKLVSHDTNN